MMSFPGWRTCLLIEFSLTLGARKLSSVVGGERAKKSAQQFSEHHSVADGLGLGRGSAIL